MKKTQRFVIVSTVITMAVSLLAVSCVKQEIAPEYAHAYRLNESGATRSPEPHRGFDDHDHSEQGIDSQQVSAADTLSDLTLPKKLANTETLTVLAVVHVTTKSGDKRKFLRDITRSHDRVHVSYRHQGQEWLFIRNPIDIRRATGELADHRNKTVFTFFETDLVDAGVGRGWLDVMTLGVPYDVLQSMKKTGEAVQRDGLVFEKYVADVSSDTGISVPAEVWWNDAHFLPLKIVRTVNEGRWEQELVKIEKGGSAAFLSPLSARYQTYDAMDMSDWADSEAVENGTAVVSGHMDGHHH